MRIGSYVGSFRGFEPDATRFILAGLLLGASISLFWIDFNLYLSALGFDPATIGLVATVGSFAGLVVAFPASALSDRIGRRAVLVGSGALGTISLVGFVVFPTLPAIALLVFVWNVALGAFFVVQNPFLVEHSRPEHRNELFSLVFAIENATNVVAAVVGGVAAQWVAGALGFDPAGPDPFRFLLAAMALLSGLGTLTLLLIADDRPGRRPQPAHATVADGAAGAPGAPHSRSRTDAPLRRSRLRVPRIALAGDRATFGRLLLPGFLIGCGAGQLIPFLNLFIERKFGLDLASLNAVFAVTSLGTILAILLQPLIARRVGKVASVVLVQATSIPFLIVLGFSPVLWTVVVAMAIRSSLMNAGNPIANAFSMELVDPGDRATFSAAQSVLWSLGWVIGGPFYSLTQATLGFERGYAVNFVTIIVLYAVATALYWRWFHGVERSARRGAVPEPTG